MGQNYSTAAADGNVRAGIDIPELQDLSYEKSLGTARFLKTIRARHAEGLVVVKLFVKPLATFPLDRYRRQLRRTSLRAISSLQLPLITFQVNRKL